MNLMKIYRKHLSVIILLSVAIASLPLFYVSYKVYQYKTYIWLPNYFLKGESNKIDKLENGHVMFLFVDHHEPGYGEKGSRKSKEWCKAYRNNISGLFDDFGNPFQYTWFYPYDHLNSQVVMNLNELVYTGLGEVEFHWHIANQTNESFKVEIAKATKWFNSYGVMIANGENSKPQFGFVHGNWALDSGDGNPNHCGVTRQLDLLKEAGCYADFTFSTLSTTAQPKKINSIYYSVDTDESKSYNSGKDSEVGVKNDGFMIFEGPICWDWHDLIWDCAALELTSPFKPHRVKLWFKWAPTVKGRPDWLFVKVFTHGMQSKKVILSDNFRSMVLELKKYCTQKKMSLHFVTAREAYNIVKAAENGKQGNPEQFRDYMIQKPINREQFITNTLTFK